MRWVVALVIAGCGRVDFDVAKATGDAPVGGIDAPSDAAVVAGAWAFVSAEKGVPDTSTGPPITSTAVNVEVGDLVVPICRGSCGFKPSLISYTIAPATSIALAPMIQDYDASSQYWHAITWGLATEAGSIAFTTPTLPGASDCLVNVFRGATGPAPTMVDKKVTTGGAGGLAMCGPIATVANGIAIYDVERTSCIDKPIAGPFVQLGTAFGNTWGAWTPTDGTSGSAQMTDCGNTGGWICTTVSLTP